MWKGQRTPTKEVQTRRTGVHALSLIGLGPDNPCSVIDVNKFTAHFTINSEHNMQHLRTMGFVRMINATATALT